MDVQHLGKALALRFSCTCQVVAKAFRSYPGRGMLSVIYDTPWVPHTWEDFVRYDDQTRHNMADFLRLEMGVSENLEIVIEHAARGPQLRWLPVGACGVMQVPAAPLYFERTQQMDKYRTDEHVLGRPFTDF